MKNKKLARVKNTYPLDFPDLESLIILMSRTLPHSFALKNL